jgi:hypothetical protein
MSSTDLVGPLPTVQFRGGPKPEGSWRDRQKLLPAVAYVPPKNTLDPRYDACTDHHVACDCREAEFAEERAEQRMERQQMKAAFDAILAGHETRRYGDDGAPGCMCTGCQLARACHMYPANAYEASGQPA